MTLWLPVNCQAAVGTHRYPSAAVFKAGPLNAWPSLLLCSHQLEIHMSAGRPRVCKSLGKKYGEVILPEKHLLFGTEVHVHGVS